MILISCRHHFGKIFTFNFLFAYSPILKHKPGVCKFLQSRASSVDGRPNRINKAAFFNFCGVVWLRDINIAWRSLTHRTNDCVIGLICVAWPIKFPRSKETGSSCLQWTKMAPRSCLAIVVVSVLSFQACIVVESLNNGLARTPPSKSATWHLKVIFFVVLFWSLYVCGLRQFSHPKWSHDSQQTARCSLL